MPEMGLGRVKMRRRSIAIEEWLFVKTALIAQGASGLNLEVGTGKYHSSLRFDF
jgi:hypothetical protein